MLRERFPCRYDLDHGASAPTCSAVSEPKAGADTFDRKFVLIYAIRVKKKNSDPFSQFCLKFVITYDRPPLQRR